MGTVLKVSARILRHAERCSLVSFAGRGERFFAVSSNSVMNIFDRKTKRHQRNVAANMADHHVYDYLKDEVGSETIRSVRTV